MTPISSSRLAFRSWSENDAALAEAMPDQAAAIQKQIEGEGLSHATITRVCKRLATRAAACQKDLPHPELG